MVLLTVEGMTDDDIVWPEVAKAIIRMASIPDGVVLAPEELDQWLDALAETGGGHDGHASAVG